MPDSLRVPSHSPAQTAPRRCIARGQDGFTLIELMLVMIVLGILTGIAIPSFLQYQGRAREAAAQANIRAAIPSIELYFSENATYAGISHSALKSSYDAGLELITFPSASTTTYCVEATVQSHTYSKNGPSTEITKGSC